MKLRNYRQKRDFSKTIEPSGKSARSTRKKGWIFVVQKHAASHLHYDLRLELHGVLKSWAVPKGPCLDPGVKRLAIHVEDHPPGYATFEGEIPKGEYGAGSVVIWDKGVWEPEEDAEKAYKSGKLKFTLYGERLKGHWVLIRTGSTPGNSTESWLLRKEKDEFARSLSEGDILDMKKARTAEHKKPRQSSKIKASSSGFQLASLSASLPLGDDWIFEIKYDGYRVQAIIQDGNVRLITRNDNDVSDQFSSIADQLKGIRTKRTVLDGEIVMIDAQGRSSFQLLQNSLSGKGPNNQLRYYVFDMPFFDATDKCDEPLESRKRDLRRFIRKLKSPRILYSEELQGDSNAILQEACRLGLEGIICKKKGSLYRARRSKDWLKVKCARRQEFVIGGFTSSTNKTYEFGALLLGYHDADGTLVYAGRVGTGFNARSRSDLKKRLTTLSAKKSPFSPNLSSSQAERIHWVRPELVAEVAFSEWTDDNKLRHPSFQGLREDKVATEVIREMPGRAPGSAPGKRRRGKVTIHQVGGVDISHPDRPVFKNASLTKEELAAFYRDAESIAMPFFRARPLVLVRCPEGGSKPCFFQKRATEGMPADIPRVSVRIDNEKVEYMMVSEIRHLIELVQINTIEFHAWGSRADRIENPDRITFDLDPAEDVEWKRVAKAARDLREFLEELSLKSFLKLTGGKGLHVVIPVAAKYTWAEIGEFSKAVAMAFSQRYEGPFTLNMSKLKRKGKIYIDFLRNARGATAIVPFSARARPGAPFALPIDWKGLPTRPVSWSLEEIRKKYLKQAFDPWEEMEKTRQNINRALKVLSAK